MITFNRFEYSKELFEQYKGSLDLDEEAIVLIDSGTDKYIYAKGSYFGSTEIYKGNIEPTDESIKLWIDTNEQSIKYKDNTDTWVTISSGEGSSIIDTEMSDTSENPVQNKVIKHYVDEKTKQNIHVGDKPPEDEDVDIWVDPDEEPDNENPLIIDTQLDLNSANPVQNSVITKEIYRLQDEKQDVLKSGENIKTINNESILGEGNIDLESKYLKKTDAEAFITEDEVAKVAFTGNFNDLDNIPDFNLIKDSCTVYSYTYEESSYAPFTPEQRESNADAFIKIRQAISDKKDINITVVVVYDSGENIEYRDCYITDAMYSHITNGGSTVSVLIGVEIESATIIQDINKPYLSHVKIDRFGNDAEYPESAGSVKATVTNTYLATDKDLDKHTTTYIGTDAPTNSKYNLWVDTTNEEVVFKYKDADNTWQILSTGGSDSIIVDTELNATSENPIANKVVYNMAVSLEGAFSEIDEKLSKKANTKNGLVEGRGFKVSDNKKYYLPDAFVEGEEDVENTNILATKAEVLSNEVIDNKATVYNLYAMDDLSAEQLEANAKAVESVQNREVAIYKVYTNDDTYAIADVKLVPGPYLEAYVYVNNPDTNSKQATITKYTYTFTQAGEYTTSDKEEVVVPSLSKVEEIVVNSGGGGGGGSIAVDDALSFESTNPVQNKVVTENLDGIAYWDLDLSTLDSDGLDSFYAKLMTTIGDSGRVKSFYCLYKGDVVKVDRLSMIDGAEYVFVSKGMYQYVLIGNTLIELPWVFTLGGDNTMSYAIFLTQFRLCKEAVIDIDGIRYPVISFEYKDNYITLYAFVKDHINQYKVTSDGNMTLVSSESIISTEVVNNLESDSTTAALSANQGRVLSEKINSEKENIINNIVSNEEVIASAFNDIHIVIKDIKENISKNITKEELQYEIDDLKSKIISNEEVIANALSDLNVKFLDLESRLRDVEKNTEQ